jgi:hypothetical protein
MYVEAPKTTAQAVQAILDNPIIPMLSQQGHEGSFYIIACPSDCSYITIKLLPLAYADRTLAHDVAQAWQGVIAATVAGYGDGRIHVCLPTVSDDGRRATGVWHTYYCNDHAQAERVTSELIADIINNTSVLMHLLKEPAYGL